MIHNLFFNGHVFGSMCVRQNRNFFVLKGIFGLLFILVIIENIDRLREIYYWFVLSQQPEKLYEKRNNERDFY